jgi:xanthine dehydrogenase YagR molybdenum-binding subunit
MAADEKVPAQPETPTRADTFLIGVGEIKTVERRVPLDEPPPWPVNAELAVVGRPAARQDGRAKVTGAARYAFDVQLPGMLYARLVRATATHARIVAVDTAAAERHPGVRAVYVMDRIQGSAVVQDKTKELPSKYPIVRYAGQPIAAVAAVSLRAADEAARLVSVQYEQLPFVVDLDDARREGAPPVFPAAADQEETAGGGGGGGGVPQRGNVRGPMGARGGPRGDVAKGFAEADAVVEAEYRARVQTHAAMEPHGVVADWRDDGLTVYASTQSTLSVRDELAAIFDLPKSKVRVLTEHMGGGFGAKFGAGNHGVVAAHLSRQAKAPVWLFADRREEHESTGNRPDAWQRLKVGAKKDGTLTAIHLVSYGTAGVGTGAGTGGPAEAMYQCPNLLLEQYDVFVNAGPGAAMRAPGHPQGCFALEQAVDELAEKLGLDPLALRDLNDPLPSRRAERKLGAEIFDWARRRKPGSDPGRVKRGVGVAQSVWYRINSMDSGCEVRITRDGSVEAFSAVQDIGTGIKTVMAQVVAEELGLRPADVTVRIGDTAWLPGPPSGGSMTTGSITPAVRNAAYKAKQQFLQQVARPIGAPSPAALALAGGKLSWSGGSLGFRQAAAKLPVEQVSAQAMRTPEYGSREFMFLGGVQFCELEVDTDTGVVRPLRFVAVHDCGRPMNPLALRSQVNGGIIQGVSYALYEERKLDRLTGVMVNADLEQYKIAGAREVPRIEVHFVEEYLGRSSTDAGGIGEPATIPTAAALANAFYNATGVRMRELPMTPARVLAALRRTGGAL